MEDPTKYSITGQDGGGKHTIVQGDLDMERDMEFNGSLSVSGDISGKEGKRYNLKVDGDLYLRSEKTITVGDLSAGNIRTAYVIDAINVNSMGHVIASKIKVKNMIAEKAIICFELEAEGNVTTRILVPGELRAGGTVTAERLETSGPRSAVCEKLILLKRDELSAAIASERMKMQKDKAENRIKIKS